MTALDKMDKYLKAYNSSYDLARKIMRTNIAIGASYSHNLRSLHADLMDMYREKKPLSSDLKSWIDSNL